MIVKILTFGFSACAGMKTDDAAMHKLQDGNKETLEELVSDV